MFDERECDTHRRGRTPYMQKLLKHVEEHPELIIDNKHGGGAPPGEGNGRAVLTEKMVRVVRKAFDKGEETTAQIAKRLGVSGTCVYQIGKRITWKHVK